MENRKFFEPAIHWVGEKDGKTVSECPLIYYTVAKLWRLFGYHEFIFRLVNVLLVYLGLFSLFKLTHALISDKFWSYIITLVLFTSPILVYYANNFIADAPAFGLALTGCFFIWKGVDKQKQSWYLFSFVLFLLGGLIKISSIIIFIAILTIHIYLLIFSKKEKSGFYRWYYLIPYLIVISVLFAWYKFAINYNQKNITGVFLTGIYPFWDIDILSGKKIWSDFVNNLLPSYLNKLALYLILLLFAASFFFYRKVNKHLLYLSLLVFIGVITYILLFYQAFNVHDYYLLNLLVFVPLPFITIIEMLKRNYPSLLNSSFLKILFVCFLLFLMYRTSVINRMKYSTKDWIVRTNFVIPGNEINYWSAFHTDYEKQFKAYETITPYLRNLEIDRTDRVLSLPDASVNISLYFMDQKGYTNFGYNNVPSEQKMDIYKKNGVKYLIIDTALNEKAYLKPYLNHKIGNYNNIDIYKF